MPPWTLSSRCCARPGPCCPTAGSRHRRMPPTSASTGSRSGMASRRASPSFKRMRPLRSEAASRGAFRLPARKINNFGCESQRAIVFGPHIEAPQIALPKYKPFFDPLIFLNRLRSIEVV